MLSHNWNGNKKTNVNWLRYWVKQRSSQVVWWLLCSKIHGVCGSVDSLATPYFRRWEDKNTCSIILLLYSAKDQRETRTSLWSCDQNNDKWGLKYSQGHDSVSRRECPCQRTNQTDEEGVFVRSGFGLAQNDTIILYIQLVLPVINVSYIC